MRKFMLAALPYIIVVLLGSAAGSYNWWITFFEPSPEDVFFEELPELEEYARGLRPQFNEQQLLVLYFLDLSKNCGRVGYLKELIESKPRSLMIVVVVDSSHTQKDIKNAQDINDIKCEIRVISRKDSKKWMEFEKKEMAIDHGKSITKYDGVGVICKKTQKSDRVSVFSRDDLINLLNKVDSSS